MFSKIAAVFSVFKTGAEVADPLAWKKGQITAGLLAGFFGALISFAKGYGYDLPLSNDQLLEIGGAVVAIFGLFNTTATVVSTTKFGPPPNAPERAVTGAPWPEIVSPPVDGARPVTGANVLDGLDTTYRG